MSKGLEYQFCTEWGGWDIVDTFALQFNNVTLRKEVADIVGREVVDCMTIWGDSCTVTFWSSEGDSEVSLKFKAELVVDKI